MTSKYISVTELDDSGSSCVVTQSLQPLSGGMTPNLLINGDFAVAQRGTSFDATTTPKNDDDTYLLDRWVLLSDGNDVVDVDQIETAVDLPAGARAAMKYTWETANKQAGLLQIVEGLNSRPAIGGTASLSFQAKASGLANLRAVVLSWDSTEDTVTSDVVTTWNGAGTNPTFATNWTAENTPGNLALSTSWETYTIDNISVDTASTTNIAVFIWLDDTDAAVNDTLFVTGVKLEVSEVATAFVARPYGQEYNQCLRYYWRDNVATGLLKGYSRSTVAILNYIGELYLPLEMRTTPIPSVYPVYNTGPGWIWNDSVVNAPWTGGPTIVEWTSNSIGVRAECAATLTPGRPVEYYNNTGVDGFIELNAEL